MKSGEINTLHKTWFESPAPPKNTGFNFTMSEQLKERCANPNDKTLE